MRKLILILCIAFVVVCYGYPCFVLPFGNYNYTITVDEKSVTTSYNFGFNGKVKVSTSATDTTSEFYYKLKGNQVIISEDETFDDNDTKLTISNMYSVGVLGENAVNQVGIWITIAVGVLALVIVITIPSKRR